MKLLTGVYLGAAGLHMLYLLVVEPTHLKNMSLKNWESKGTPPPNATPPQEKRPF